MNNYFGKLKFLHVSGITILLLSLLFISSANAQSFEDVQEKVIAIVDAVKSETGFNFVDTQSGIKYDNTNAVPADVKIKIASPYNDWRYWNGVLNIAMINLAKTLNKPDLKEFAQRNIAFSFDSYKYFEEKYNNEGKWNYPFGQRFIMNELDDCGAMGASVIEVYKFDKQQRYLDYINLAADHIMNKQVRLDDGTLVRTFPHEYTLWADDLYMGLSFISRMGEITNENKYFDFAAGQVINYHKYLFDEQKELMCHNWYSDVKRTGVAFWGRANGWAMVAQVDLLDRLPDDHPLRNELIHLLQQHILGIAKYQSANGLWHQLLDKTDSYYETSCSAMFTYTIARAVNRKYIEPRYASIALRGWEGITTKITPDGKVEGVCTGTVVSDNLVDYYNRPAPKNDIHGIGTLLLAGSEIIKLIKTNN